MRESIPEHDRCHPAHGAFVAVADCVVFRAVSTPESIRPLHDVWLRPRRVFRELAAQPVGLADYALAAGQGLVSWLAFSRQQDAGKAASVAGIFLKAVSFGSLAGIASLLLMGAIYARLGRRVDGVPVRNAVVHILAYGGVPVVASLGLWILAALLAGEAAFVQTPAPDADGFLVLLIRMQFIAYVLLMLWSIVLQVMGFSEIQGVATRRALGVWLLGQLVGFLALLALAVLVTVLVPDGGGI